MISRDEVAGLNHKWRNVDIEKRLVEQVLNFEHSSWGQRTLGTALDSDGAAAIDLEEQATKPDAKATPEFFCSLFLPFYINGEANEARKFVFTLLS